MNYKASDVDGSWATNALHETIREFNSQASRQTEQMLLLTKVMAWLTGVMLLGLVVQICLAIWPPSNSQTQASPVSAEQSASSQTAQSKPPQALPPQVSIEAPAKAQPSASAASR